MKKFILILSLICSISAWADDEETGTYSFDIIFSPDSFKIGPYYLDDRTGWNYYPNNNSIIYDGADAMRPDEDGRYIGKFRNYSGLNEMVGTKYFEPYIPYLYCELLLPPDFRSLTRVEIEPIERHLIAENFRFVGYGYPDTLYVEEVRLALYSYKSLGIHFQGFYIQPYFFDAKKDQLYISSVRLNIVYQKGPITLDSISNRAEYDYLVNLSRIYCLNKFEDLYNAHTLNSISYTYHTEAAKISAYNNKTIRCNIPQTVLNATLTLFDLSGKRCLSQSLNERGHESVTTLDHLPAGIYLCQLITDGKVADTRRIIIK